MYPKLGARGKGETLQISTAKLLDVSHLLNFQAQLVVT